MVNRERQIGGRGFTLVELLLAMSITSMVAVAISGLSYAVHTAWRHVQESEEIQLQAQAALERVQFMINECGVYQTSGQPTVLGLAAVSHGWYMFELPDTLVVWSGGREGGRAARGVVERLPRIDELVVYSVDPDDPQRMVEFTFPTLTSSIDFQGANFESTILGLLSSDAAEKTRLCDRLRVSELTPSDGTDTAYGNLQFTLTFTPSDGEIASATPGSSAWRDLMWSQSVCTGTTGLRQATVWIELIAEPAENPEVTPQSWMSESTSTGVPFFASQSYRYVYRP